MPLDRRFELAPFTQLLGGIKSRGFQ